MDICNWCLNPVTEEGLVYGWHDECVQRLSEVMEILSKVDGVDD